MAPPCRRQKLRFGTGFPPGYNTAPGRIVPTQQKASAVAEASVCQKRLLAGSVGNRCSKRYTLPEGSGAARRSGLHFAHNPLYASQSGILRPAPSLLLFPTKPVALWGPLLQSDLATCASERRSKLRTSRLRASAKTRSLRCSSFSPQSFALRRPHVPGARFNLPVKPSTNPEGVCRRPEHKPTVCIGFISRARQHTPYKPVLHPSRSCCVRPRS